MLSLINNQDVDIAYSDWKKFLIFVEYMKLLKFGCKPPQVHFKCTVVQKQHLNTLRLLDFNIDMSQANLRPRPHEDGCKRKH